MCSGTPIGEGSRIRQIASGLRRWTREGPPPFPFPHSDQQFPLNQVGAGEACVCMEAVFTALKVAGLRDVPGGQPADGLFPEICPRLHRAQPKPLAGSALSGQIPVSRRLPVRQRQLRPFKGRDVRRAFLGSRRDAPGHPPNVGRVRSPVAQSALCRGSRRSGRSRLDRSPGRGRPPAA